MNNMESTAAGSRTTSLSSLLHPLKLRQLAADWLAEDVPAFDYGGFVVGEKTEAAVLLCKSPGVLAGALESGTILYSFLAFVFFRGKVV